MTKLEISRELAERKDMPLADAIKAVDGVIDIMKDAFKNGRNVYLRGLGSFVIKERKLMTVGKNCYVSLFKHHYSVPREHVGKRVVILYDADTVEIYCGMNLVAVHDRCDIPYTY